MLVHCFKLVVALVCLGGACARGGAQASAADWQRARASECLLELADGRAHLFWVRVAGGVGQTTFRRLKSVWLASARQ